MSTDYEQTYDDFWKEIVENADGTLNLDQIKRELHDYHLLIDQVPLVYDDVTGGRISKANTMAFEVINQAEERRQEVLREQVEEVAVWLDANGCDSCPAVVRAEFGA